MTDGSEDTLHGMLKRIICSRSMKLTLAILAVALLGVFMLPD